MTPDLLVARIAVRKYTSFGVHPAGKHLGNGPGILPNINYLSVYMGIQRFGYASVMLPNTRMVVKTMVPFWVLL